MTIKVHDLRPAPGSTKRPKRVGRGIAGKGGKTAGRGTKGQKARSRVPTTFEGGQMPLHMRVPKLKGFNNPFRVEYHVVNLETLATFDTGAEVSPATLRDQGLVHKTGLVKVLARGDLGGKRLTVKAHAFSRAAKAAIEAAGGTTEVLPTPWNVRPRAAGNQHMNR
jgi:large subunit ribosomal protein L15